MMKLIFVTVAFLVCAYADVSELSNGYNYPQPQAGATQSQDQPQRDYLPPNEQQRQSVASNGHSHSQYISPERHEYHVNQHHDHRETHAQENTQNQIPPLENNYLPPDQPSQQYSGTFEPSVEEAKRFKTIRRVVFRYRH